MKFVQLFRRMLRIDEVILSHVPVQTEHGSKEGLAAEKRRKEKLAAAKAKHRQPFALERLKPRETEPSIVLADIQRKSDAAQNNNRPTLIRVNK